MSLPTLTTQNLANLRVWYDALLSGKYKELPRDNRDPFHKDGMCCAVGCAQSALGALRIGIDDKAGDFSRPQLIKLIPSEIYAEMWRFFLGAGRHAAGHTFSDCAAYLRDYIFDNYHVDLLDVSPVADPAPAPSPEVRA